MNDYKIKCMVVKLSEVGSFTQALVLHPKSVQRVSGRIRQVEIEIHNINSMDSEKMELWHDLNTQVVPDSRGLWNHGVNLNTYGSRVQIIFSGLLHLQLINQKTMSNPQNSGANEKPRSHHHGPIRYLSCRDKGAP